MRVVIGKRHRRDHRRETGFTLVETIVALALGSVIIGALYSGFASGFTAMRTAREDLRATQIILNRMERIRLCTWSQINDPLYNPKTSTDYLDSAAKRIPCTVTFQANVPAAGTLPGAYRTNMLLVTVTANWNSGSTKHKRSMQTYVARDGMENFVSMGR